jgi:glycosyltransferase involved in cell wall biosynthesis
MNTLVSVCIFTYNHEKLIERCIESALMQNTDFDFEIVLGEDYSKDKTRNICNEYVKKYPNKVRLLDRGKNLGMCENIFDSLKNCKGKYTAILDGDDYWIDPLKLQKQFNFLETHSEMNLVFHQSLIINELNGTFSYFVKENKSLYTIEDIINNWCMATGAMFFRTKAMDFPQFVYHTHNFDLAIQLILNKNGEKIGYIDELMSVYNINVGSNTNNQNYDAYNTAKRQKLLFEEFNEYSNLKFSKTIEHKLLEINSIIQQNGRISVNLIAKKLIKDGLKIFNLKLSKIK